MVVADYTIHVTLSNSMVYFEISATKLVPINVTKSPPYTYPHLGVIEVKRGVLADE